MALVYVLSVLAYICLVAAVYVTLRRASQQIELDYPLTQYPLTWKPSTAEASMTKSARTA